jgi:hypothetical protein
MTGTAAAAAEGGAALPERGLVPVAAALAAAVASQIWIALGFGGMAGAARADLVVAAALILLLALPAAASLAAVWSLRSVAIGWPLAAALVAAGVLMRLPYFGVGPMLEDDHYRYMLDGAMVAHGLSPYAFAPEQVIAGASALPGPVLDAGRASVAAVNFPDLRSIYPGGGQAIFALAHLAAPWSIDALRAAILVAEALTAVLLVAALRRCGMPPVFAAFVWCNPLLAFSLTGQAHVDAWLPPPILAALLLARRGSCVAAGAALGFAVGVKLWPVLLAPLVMRALWPSRAAVAGFAAALGVVILALCGPLMLASLGPNAGLAAYAQGWSNNNAPFAWVSYAFYLAFGEGTGERLLRAGVAALSAAAALAIAIRPVDDLRALVGRAALLAALLFYLSPAQFPWYAAWFLPLAAAAGSLPLLAASAGLPIYYLFFPLAETEFRNVHAYGVAFLHLVPVMAAAWWARAKGARP